MLTRGYMTYLNYTIIQLLLYEEAINLHMLGSIMLNRVVCDVDRGLVVTPQI